MTTVNHGHRRRRRQFGAAARDCVTQAVCLSESEGQRCAVNLGAEVWTNRESNVDVRSDQTMAWNLNQLELCYQHNQKNKTPAKQAPVSLGACSATSEQGESLCKRRYQRLGGSSDSQVTVREEHQHCLRGYQLIGVERSR